MRFTVTRLCGGKALMMIPGEDIRLDMERALPILESMAEDVRSEGLMTVCRWKGMEMTLYEQGKIMLFPLQERSEGISYANEILDALSDCRV